MQFPNKDDLLKQQLGRLSNKYDHQEAFCLMTYRCKQCLKEEVLWNSRDGVTPYIIRCQACGGESSHINFEKDKRELNYFPPSGSRVFVNLTHDRYLIYVRAKVQAFWEADHMSFRERFGSKEAAYEALSKSKMTPGEPDIMVIR